MKIPIRRYKINKDHLPKGLIAEGILYAVIVATLALSILFIIPIQNKVKGEVVLYSEGVPYSITTLINGPLYSVVGNKTEVKKGDLIATQLWNINPTEIDLTEKLAQFQLDMTTKSLDSLTQLIREISPLKIENLHSQIDAINSAISQYRILYKASDRSELEESLNNEIERRNLTLNQLDNRDAQYRESVKLLRQQLRSDSILFAEGAISYREYDNRKIQQLEIEEKISENRVQKEAFKNEIAEITSRKYNLSSNTETEKANYFLKIYDRLDRFKEQFYTMSNRRLIYAPVSGEIAWDVINQNGNEYQAGVTFATITPSPKEANTQGLYYISVPISKSGEIESGQSVYIDIDEYTPDEYGYLNATVIRKEATPLDGGRYRVIVNLTKGFKTSYGIDLPSQAIYHGKGEILLSKQSIASKISKEFTHRTTEVLR